MATCKACAAPIGWCFEEKTGRWRAVDPSTFREDDEEFENGRFYEKWHKRHRCAEWSDQAGAKKEPPKRDPFEVLHLLPTAPIEVVQAAFRAMSFLHHPDRGGDHEAMAEVNLAWEQIQRQRA